ncbi:MAG: MerR family transcriptional regulator [Rhodospirillales bacterium]|nr:MerR family transcriptional regulator [Rhodospirillales bacterium]
MSAEAPPARRSNKSASAFRTISEVAAELDLPQHVLRFWEGKFSQIRPLKRGGGRRYYRPEDIDLLRRIRGLLYDDGYTIKGVQKLLKQESGRGADGAEKASPRVADGGLGDSEKAALRQILAELEDIRKLV